MLHLLLNAAAYGNPNIFDEVRNLGSSDINLRNCRDSKDPAVVIRLLDLGASEGWKDCSDRTNTAQGLQRARR